MRIGSIGTHGISTSYYSDKLHQKQTKMYPNFKADVRIADGIHIDGEVLPEAQAKPLLQSLVHAMTAYKDWGSDNILVYLKPVIEPGSWMKKPRANIEVLAMYKDPAIEVQKLKEDLKNNPEKVKKSLKYHNDELEKAFRELKKNPEKKLEDYQAQIMRTTAYDKIFDKDNTVTPQRLDKHMKFVIDTMTDYIPFEKNSIAPFCWIKKNAFVTPDIFSPDEKDSITEKLFTNYPQWEKDLWDKIGYDYKKDIYEQGEVFVP